MTIEHYRWESSAAGWARYGKSDEKMAEWLEQAKREREQRTDCARSEHFLGHMTRGG